MGDLRETTAEMQRASRSCAISRSSWSRQANWQLSASLQQVLLTNSTIP
jgi:hypothetical protein